MSAITVRCLETGCAREGKVVNVITGIESDRVRDWMIESWADASDPNSDACPACGVLGVPDEPTNRAGAGRRGKEVGGGATT